MPNPLPAVNGRIAIGGMGCPLVIGPVGRAVMSDITPVISATGLFTPPESISNEELVRSFNTYAARFNAAHADEIAAGTIAEVPMS